MSSRALPDSLRETLGVFDGSRVPRTTTEVAERLDLGRRSTYDRLERLVDRGRLETKKVGASGRVWWRPPPPSRAGRPEGTPGSPATDGPLGGVLDGADVGVFVLDEAFEVVWANEAAGRYFGLDPGRVLGRDKREIVESCTAPAVEDAGSFAETVLATYEDNTYAERFECRVTAGEGREGRWLEHRSEPIESGARAGGRVELYHDVTERKRSERASRRARGRFESLIEAVEEYAIFTLDAEGRVRSWNPGAERIKGYGSEEILGEPVSTFYTGSDRAAGVPARNLAAARREGSVEDEGWRVRADGSRFWASVTITSIRDDDGTLAGYAKVTRDMTDRRERERAIRRERDLLEKTLETSPVGILVLDPGGTVVRANGRAEELLCPTAPGLEGESYLEPEWEVRTESGEPVAGADHPVARVLETGSSVRGFDHEVTLPDGTDRWLSSSAAPVLDDEGEVERVVVALEDVTRFEEQTRRLERQRDDLRTELDDVFERVSDGFFGLDTELRFTYVNERAEDLLGACEHDLLDVPIWETLEPGPIAREVFDEVLETQEPTTFEEYYEPLDTWFENHVYPSETGLSVHFRDVTERKERERELERYGTMVSAIDDGVYVVDESGRFTTVNEAYAEMTGYSREELLGAPVSTVVDEATRDRAAELERELATGRRETARLEASLETATGDRLPAEATFALLPTDDGAYERVGVVRDVTERKERERELELYEAAVETIDDGVYIVDDDNRFRLVNDAHAELTGYAREELLGSHASRVTTEGSLALAEGRLEGLVDSDSEAATVRTELVPRDGDRVPVETRFAPFPLGEERYGRVGVVRDITDRRARERNLRDRMRQLEAIADLGRSALGDPDLDALMAEATETVAAVFDADYCKVLDLDPGAAELLLRQGVGWDEGVVGSATVSAVADDSQAAHTLRSAGSVVVEDLEAERRFDGPDLLTDHDVRSGISVPIGSREDPWGILGVHDTDRREFSERDADFVQSVANVLATAIDRRDRERELERRNEQITALNSLNGVVREITGAVIDRSTREEIEATVCERLAETDSYLFAWIGDVDVASRTVRLRTEAGVEGYLDGVTISVDPDDERSEGPTGRALRTGEIQTSQDVRTEDRYAPWRDHVEAHGFRSSAAIPIAHEGTTYGVLNVYAERPDAFEGRERTVVGQLGEVVGHAIAAEERKRALMTDEVVEAEFAIRGVPDAFGLDGGVSGRLTLDHAVPLGEDEFLLYGSATADAVGSVEALAGAFPHWGDVSFRDDVGDDEVGFEVRLSEPPVLSVLASVGGSVERAVLEDGDLRMTLHLPPGTDVRRVTDTVRDVYPGAELLRRRQTTRPEGSLDGVRRGLAADLTDRQRAALEAAYHAGYFEWPRETSAEELAASLDIASPTLHYHLRRAQRKAFDSLLSVTTLPPRP